MAILPQVERWDKDMGPSQVAKGVQSRLPKIQSLCIAAYLGMAISFRPRPFLSIIILLGFFNAFLCLPPPLQESHIAHAPRESRYHVFITQKYQFSFAPHNKAGSIIRESPQCRQHRHKQQATVMTPTLLVLSMIM